MNSSNQDQESVLFFMQYAKTLFLKGSMTSLFYFYLPSSLTLISPYERHTYLEPEGSDLWNGTLDNYSVRSPNMSDYDSPFSNFP